MKAKPDSFGNLQPLWFDSVNLAIVFVVWLLTMGIVWTVPTTILDDSVIARWIVVIVGLVLPIEASGTKSTFPQISQLAFAVAWTSFPSFWLLWRRYYRAAKQGYLIQRRSSWKVSQYFFLFLIAGLFFLLGYAPMFLMQGQDTRHVLFGSNLTHLGLFVIVMPGASAFFLAGAFSILKKMLTDKI